MPGQVIGTVNVQVGNGHGGGIGRPGATGVQGASGIGATGFTGATGATGVQGASGIGATGPQGDFGATGIQGPAGTSVSIIGSIANVYVNPPNDPQVTLNTSFPGATIGQGVIDEFTGHLWVYDSTTWVDVGVITGPQGASGIGATGYTGATGATGPQGNIGATGLQGDFGATGIQGQQGATGVQGNIGATGVQGDTGATGVQGNIGATGIQGASGVGATGLTGATGVSGIDGATGVQGASGTGVQPSVTYTTSNTNQVVFDTIDTSVYRSAKYEMQITSGSHYSATELRLLVDEPNAYLTEYGAIGDALGNFSSYYSPLTNDYSSPNINIGGVSVWTGTNLRFYTNNPTVALGLLSIPVGTTITVYDSSNNPFSVTLATAFVNTLNGIYDATTTISRSPTLLLGRVSWTGSGLVELRFQPVYNSTTLKYLKTTIEV